ncbi:MAG: putative bifunctional diguanylate cyclase/phosphodiesterase [Burkholderiales bacterium]
MNLQDLVQRHVGLVWLNAKGELLRVNSVLALWAGCESSPQSVQVFLPSLNSALWSTWTKGSSERCQDLMLVSGSGSQLPVRCQLDPDGDGWLLSLWVRLGNEGRATIDAMQQRVLEAVALSRPLPEVMDLLCRELEAAAPGVMCSVLLVDAKGHLHPLAAPSLPEAYSAALEGVPIGSSTGSCGTAAWRRQPVEVRSIATDPLWADYKQLALQYGLASCWSTPVMLDNDRVGATFAIYYREEAPVADYHRHLVQACSQLCRIALLNEERDARVERLAYFDAVTQLPNRTLFTRRAEVLLAQQLQEGGSAALLLMDLDRFKAVNELQGHAAGNEVLRLVAERLTEALPGMNTLARLGDDEFVVLLPYADRARAEHTAQALCAVLTEPLRPERGHECRLGMSVGFSVLPDDGRQLDVLLKHADLALHAAKGAGRDCVRGFSSAMAHALQEKAWMEAELRKALEAHQLLLHFQPKVHLASGQLLGAEVLLRWPVDGRGWVPPDQFIPLAEECGLIGAIDAWVLEAACKQLAQWRSAGIRLPSLSVNVSPARFLHDDVVTHLTGLLAQHDLPASALMLEVTERLMLDDAGDRRAVSQLVALRAMGVGVSIDDFGTGYSSLSYLRRLPVSELKLDRSFVNSLVQVAEDRALTRAVVSIAEAMGLSLVAEGVETTEQAALLRQLGCEVGQGYWLSRPLAVEPFTIWCQASQSGQWQLPG